MKTTASIVALVLAFTPAAFAAPEVGEPAPAFVLTGSDGKEHSLARHMGKYVVLEWINHGCPFVQKHYNSGNMQSLQKEVTDKGGVWLSICSSAPGTQGHMSAEDWNKTMKEKNSAATAVLIDEDGTVGKLYDAKTTPHMFVIDPKGVLVYAGAIDDKNTTRIEDAKTAHNYVRAALEESMAGKEVSKTETRPYGCHVKYPKKS